jgi:aminopeptidase N
MFYTARDKDTRFQALMHDFVQTYFNHDISTEDFKRIVEKHMSKDMDLDENQRLDWFFNEWVYGTEIPSYRFEYQLSPDGTAISSGRITQSGVSDNFKMLVPIYVDFGKGLARIGSAKLIGNTSVEINDLKLGQPIKRAAICAMDDVLALSIQNK